MHRANWIVVESPRFEIFSTMPKERTLELARDLEQFHALVLTLTGATEIESPIPTRIFAFAKSSDYRRFAPRRSAGSFHSGVRWNTILLTGYGKRLNAQDILLHEYVHFVVRQGTIRQLPVWWDEGYAEVLSTARKQMGYVEIGGVPKERAPWIVHGDWLDMRRVISATGYDDFSEVELGMFYAQAWALVHYLLLDRDDPGSIVRELPEYLDAVELGFSPVAAFEKAFGESPRDAQRAIREKLRKGGVKIVGLPEERIVYDRTPPLSRPPQPGEVAIRIGQLRLAHGDSDVVRRGRNAERDFRIAISLAPNESRGHAGLGDALKFQKRLAEAEPHFDRACELDPSDPMNELDRAEFYHDKALLAEDSSERDRLLGRAREGYRQVLEADASLPEALLMLGATHLAPGQDPREALGPIEQALKSLPSSWQVQYSLAETYVALGRERDALALMVQAYSARAEGSGEEAARKEIEAIRSRRQQAATGE